MSGIYIKGIEMPKPGKLVLVEIDENGDVFAAYDGGRTKFGEYTAIPVSNHGSLVEVVRCQECVHCCGVSGEPPFEEAYEAYCGEHDWCVSETYFCADGKRKDGGQGG